MTNSILLRDIDTEGLKDIIREVNAEMLSNFKATAQPKERYLTRHQVAEKLNISLPTLNFYTKEGKITGYRIGGRVLYKEEELDAALIKVVTSKFRR